MDFKKQAQDILAGKAKAPNQLIEFLTNRAIESRDEGNALITKIQEAEAILTVMRKRRQEIKGAVISYVEDIETLLTKDDDSETVDSEEPDKGNGKSKPFTNKERKELPNSTS